MSFLDQFQDGIGSAHAKGDEIIHLLAHQCRQLEQALEKLDAQMERDEFIRRTGSAIIGASGTAEISLGSRTGFIVQLTGLATTQSATGTGAVAIYLNSSENGQNLLYAQSGAQLLSDVFPEGTMLPDGAKLIVRFTGLTNGDTVTAAIMGKRLPLHTPVAIAGVPR